MTALGVLKEVRNMDLNRAEIPPIQIPGRVEYNGSVTCELSEGDKLSIRKKITGWEDMLDEKVPDGKKWLATIILRIMETDI